MWRNGTTLPARPHQLELDLGSSKAPMPGFIRVAKSIPAWEGKDETVSLCVLGEPSKRFGSLKLRLKRRAPRCGDVHGTARVVFTIAGRRTYRKYLIKRQAALQFSTNYLGLPLDVPKCGSDLQGYTILTCSLSHLAPCLCCGRKKQVLLSVSFGFRNHQLLRFETDLERALLDKRSGDRKLFQRCRDSCGVFVQRERCHPEV
jgi:hypothetical protein